MNQDKKEIIAGSISFLIALILFYAIGASGWLKKGADTYQVSARFEQTNGLNVGNEVRVAGIKVGEIISLELDEYYGVLATMSLPQSVLLPDDTAASVQSVSLIGKKYIELSPGGSEYMLENDGYIEFTQDSPNLQVLLDKVISMSKSKKSKKTSENN